MGDAAKSDINVDLEMYRVFYEEFRDRHALFWKLVFRFSTVIIFLDILPFVYVQNSAVVRVQWLLPCAGLVLSIPAFLLLRAEYARLRWAGEYLGTVRKKLGFMHPYPTSKSILDVKIGPFTYWTMLILSIFLSGLALYLLGLLEKV